MRMAFRIQGDYIESTQFTHLSLVSSRQISNAGTAHPGNSKPITHASMLLRSLLEKEGFLQAAEMVRDAFRLPNGPSMLTILLDFFTIRIHLYHINTPRLSNLKSHLRQTNAYTYGISTKTTLNPLLSL